MNNGANYLGHFSPEYDEPAEFKEVKFEMLDFYGSEEKTLFCKVNVKVGEHSNNNEILEAEVIDDIGNFVSVIAFLTQGQKYSIREQASEEVVL